MRRRTTFLSGNAAQTLRSYDPNGRVITLVEANGAGIPIMTIIDSYDPAGRKVTSSRQGVVTSYSYDSRDKLTGQVVANGYATFVNDPVGNVAVKWYQGSAPMTMTFDAASRMVTMTSAAAKTAYTFDAAGNMTLENLAGVTTGYVYDCENRMKKQTASDGSFFTCTYSGDGLRRTWQKAGSPVHTMIWDGSNYLGEI